ncbi:uncharacterized protein FIBRA_02612 [Fibroporia radiculosa]|uniref:AMP-dependent synthetase/ligase domain-containing protein n=1 Tax=Fibroporia radiculosa TaxID=599839 RepID=J4HV75_9APHY|nr:uncharacterized protein FIBRA_02612 [Fibroporia radiculosa]CCM00577.1 predicted protein [Fibroporia radiculosa]
MKASLRTHLTILAESASIYPSRSAIRQPVVDDSTKQILHWRSITYSELHSDVESFARYWARTLAAQGLPRRSVVGLWLGGLTYVDLLHIYGMTRAGYVPQLFSLKLSNPDVIYELLHKANAKTLIYDASYTPDLSSCPIPVHSAIDVRAAGPQTAPLPSMSDISKVKGSDIVFIYHTSGSTSGCPKLIPCSYSWLHTMITKAGQVSKPIKLTKQDVTVYMGSVCHIGQTFMFLGSLQHGSCTVQPTRIDFSSDELLDIIARCGLNRLNQFPSFLGIHMRNSRQDSKLLAQLCALDEIFYSGQPLPREDEEWMYKNNMNVTNTFANTECGVMLVSKRGGGRPDPPVHPLEGAKYGFFPVSDSSNFQNVNGQLLELVILADSPDCPDRSLRAPDGHYHTGDLFLEVASGAYVSRGRNDDWIKSSTALRCDTRAIEDNVRATCGDLITQCVVVGNGRPSPALFVETSSSMPEDRLKREIIRRTRHFHARRYLHERITSTKMVVIVPRNALPCTATKGNVRRRAVEEMFKAELDQIFSS